MKIFEWLNHLAARWQVKSMGQVLVILLVFALTGFSAMFAKKIVFAFFGISADAHCLLKTTIWMLTILPLYQLLLLFYGTLLGQFRFFWAFEKRMFGRIFSLFNRSSKKSSD